METMRGLYFEKTGEPEAVIQFTNTLTKPSPGPGQVRIRVKASPINPSDVYFIQGNYRFKPVFPQIGGLEGTGIIDALGEGVSPQDHGPMGRNRPLDEPGSLSQNRPSDESGSLGQNRPLDDRGSLSQSRSSGESGMEGSGAPLAVGMSVSFLHRGAWADYIIMPAKDIFVLPPDLPVEKAAQFIINPFTAWGLLEEVNLKEGDWLLLDAGTSAVSKLITQIAAGKRIRTILVVRDTAQVSELKALGAAAVVVFDEARFPDEIHSLTGGAGVAAALDSIGGKMGTALARALAIGGKMIVYGRMVNDDLQLNNADFIYRDIQLNGFGIRKWMESKTPGQMQQVVTQIADVLGQPDFSLGAVPYPPESFSEAIRASAAAGKSGKVILSFA